MQAGPNTKDTFLSTSKDGASAKIDRKIFANLEVKCPNDKSVKSIYRWKKCMAILHDLIQSTRMAEYCLVSSFDHEVLREMEILNSEYIRDQSDKLETSSIMSLMSRQS
jgi:hypothetical protein